MNNASVHLNLFYATITSNIQLSLLAYSLTYWRPSGNNSGTVGLNLEPWLQRDKEISSHERHEFEAIAEKQKCIAISIKILSSKFWPLMF